MYCVECGRKIVTFNRKIKKTVQPNADHDLCQKCWKSEVDRYRSKDKLRA